MFEFLQKNKKVSFIIVVVLLVFSYWLVNSFYKEKYFNELLKDTNLISELLVRFSNKGTDLELGGGFMHWTDEITGYSFSVPLCQTISISRIKDTSFDSEDIANKYFKEELELFKKVAIRKGYFLNTYNSSTSTTDKTFYDYILAYQKEDSICEAVVNPDLISDNNNHSIYNLRMFCISSLSLENSMKEQLPFLKVLGVADRRTTIRIVNKVGDFYEVGVGGYRGGSTAIIKKEGDNYNVLFVGQESPECDLIDSEGIPIELLRSVGSGTCYKDGRIQRLHYLEN